MICNMFNHSYYFYPKRWDAIGNFSNSKAELLEISIVTLTFFKLRNARSPTPLDESIWFKFDLKVNIIYQILHHVPEMCHANYSIGAHFKMRDSISTRFLTYFVFRLNLLRPTSEYHKIWGQARKYINEKIGSSPMCVPSKQSKKSHFQWARCGA